MDKKTNRKSSLESLLIAMEDVSYPFESFYKSSEYYKDILLGEEYESIKNLEKVFKDTYRLLNENHKSE